MAVDISDFETFLFANYRSDYDRATAKNVPDDVLTSIISRHSGHYSVWKRIPGWIKDRYHNILPREVLDGNVQVKEFIAKEEEIVKKEEKDTAAVLDLSVSMLAMGYSAECVKNMAENRELREELMKLLAQSGELTDEQMATWLMSRQRDKDAITREWQTNQPEKYLFHLIKEMSRSERRGEGINAEKEQELAAFMQMFSSKEDRNKLVDYLRQKPQQVALGNLTPSVMGKLTGVLSECGINIKPAKAKGEETEITRDSLANSLKKHFQWRLKMEELLKAQYAQRNMEFSNVSVRDVLSEGFKKIMPKKAQINQGAGV